MKDCCSRRHCGEPVTGDRRWQRLWLEVDQRCPLGLEHTDRRGVASCSGTRTPSAFAVRLSRIRIVFSSAMITWSAFITGSWWANGTILCAYIVVSKSLQKIRYMALAEKEKEHKAKQEQQAAKGEVGTPNMPARFSFAQSYVGTVCFVARPVDVRALNTSPITDERRRIRTSYLLVQDRRLSYVRIGHTDTPSCILHGEHMTVRRWSAPV